VCAAQVTEMARLMKQTALGYINSAGAIHLVPNPEQVGAEWRI
jgi:hypothetical protein